MINHGPHTLDRTRPTGCYVTSPGWSGNPVADRSWHDLGACSTIDPEIFQPELQDNGGYPRVALAAAKQVCRTCPAQIACLAYAMETGERWGTWGGLGWKQRLKVRGDWIKADMAEAKAAKEGATA